MSGKFLMTAEQHRRQAKLLAGKRPDLAKCHSSLADAIEARGPQPNADGEYDLEDLDVADIGDSAP